MFRDVLRDRGEVVWCQVNDRAASKLFALIGPLPSQGVICDVPWKCYYRAGGRLDGR
jgi:hypothetical protein